VRALQLQICRALVCFRTTFRCYNKQQSQESVVLSLFFTSLPHCKMSALQQGWQPRKLNRNTKTTVLAKLTPPQAPYLPAHFSNLTGPGNPKIYQCWGSHIEYRSLAQNQPAFEISTLPYSTSVTWVENTALPTTTLCDGIPRVLGAPSSQLTLTYPNKPMQTMFPNKNTIKPPTCTIQEADCTTALAAMKSLTMSFQSSVTSAYRAKNSSATARYEFESLKPPCSTVNACSPTTVFPRQTEIYSCHLVAQSPTLVYWPVSSDHCNPIAVLETATPTIQGRPNTAVFHGATITSPSALIVLHSIQGRYTSSKVYRSCGTVVPSATFLLPTQVLSSMSWSFAPNMKDTYDATQVPKSFNLADLDILPFGPYANQKGCNTELLKPGLAPPSNCPTRIFADYNPTLAVPSHATGLSGNFKGCQVGAARNAVYVPITAATVEVPKPTTWGATVRSTTEFSGVSTTVTIRTPPPKTSSDLPSEDSDVFPWERPYEEEEEADEDVLRRRMITAMETARPTSLGRS
jgi:hypothetical protein